MWLGPPAIHKRITLLPFFASISVGPMSVEPASVGRVGTGPQQVGQRQPGQSTQPGFEHAAAAREDQAFAPARIEGCKRMRVLCAARSDSLGITRPAGNGRQADYWRYYRSRIKITDSNSSEIRQQSGRFQGSSILMCGVFRYSGR